MFFGCFCRVAQKLRNSRGLHHIPRTLLKRKFVLKLFFQFLWYIMTVLTLSTRLEIFVPILVKFSVPVSPVLFFEILRGHIASPLRAKIGQALSPCARELVLINNVLTSEIKAAKKELFIGTLHALSSNILRLALCRRRKSFLRGSWEKSLAGVSLELTHMNFFFFSKTTIFRSIRFTSRLLMDELTGFGWLARSKKITPPLRGYPILSKAISTWWIVKTKC